MAKQWNLRPEKGTYWSQEEMFSMVKYIQYMRNKSDPSNIWNKTLCEDLMQFSLLDKTFMKLIYDLNEAGGIKQSIAIFHVIDASMPTWEIKAGMPFPVWNNVSRK